MAEVSLVKLPSDEFNWILFMVSQHWFRWWLGAIRHQAITWTNVHTFLCHHMASLGHNELHKTQIQSEPLECLSLFNSLSPGRWSSNFDNVITLMTLIIQNTHAVAWVLLVKLLSGEYHRTSLMGVHIVSGNSLVPSGNEPIPKPISTQIYVTIWVTRPQWVNTAGRPHAQYYMRPFFFQDAGNHCERKKITCTIEYTEKSMFQVWLQTLWTACKPQCPSGSTKQRKWWIMMMSHSPIISSISSGMSYSSSSSSSDVLAVLEAGSEPGVVNASPRERWPRSYLQ